MNRLVQILAVMLLAAFAAGTATHAYSTTEGSLRMAAFSIDDGMIDCDGCDEMSGGAVTCDQNCVQPLVGLAACGATASFFAALSPVQTTTPSIVGQAGPPERHPPRQHFPI